MSSTVSVMTVAHAVAQRSISPQEARKMGRQKSRLQQGDSGLERKNLHPWYMSVMMKIPGIIHIMGDIQMASPAKIIESVERTREAHVRQNRGK